MVDKSYSLSSEVTNKVFLVAQNGSKKNYPTIDVLDLGTGLEGERFPDTILSLHSGNKTSKDKGYLIGAFGQGGSTALSFSSATLIISKSKNKYYFTIVLKIHINNLKNYTYFYLHNNEQIIEIENNLESNPQTHLNALIKSESGTLIRMIDMEMGLGLRQSALTNPGKMMDYISTELFDSVMPITIIENRKEFESYEPKNLLRNIRGSKIKLFRSKNRFNEQYSGSFEVRVDSDVLNVDYYIVLPSKEEDWANDSKAKEDYITFNYHEKPIIFTSNGQYINGESYTKLKNKGITFLNYRLIIHVNLDQLGNKKQGLFTSNRSSMKESTFVSKMIDQIVYQASINNNITQINKIIAEKSLDKDIDIDIEGLEQDLKESYSDFLLPDKKIKFRNNPSSNPGTNDVDDYKDYIEELIITNTKSEFFKDETIRLILKTEADKYTNKNSRIDGFLNDGYFSDWEVSYMNGRIQYNISSLKPGEYGLNFVLFNDDSSNKEAFSTSNLYNFTILDEKLPREETSNRKELNIEIKSVTDKDIIIDISKNQSENKITIQVCLNHPELELIIKGRTSSEIEQTKVSLINPMALYALLLDEFYEEQKVESKNKIIADYAKTFIKYFKK